MLTNPEKIVWVNGCFDVLHVGHIKLLNYASSFGELIIGIDSDERIKSLKGNNRPINSIKDREYFLKQLRCVNEVIVFNSNNELSKYIEYFSPHYMVIGEEYKNKDIIGKEFIQKEIIYFPKYKNLSTTKILNSK